MNFLSTVYILFLLGVMGLYWSARSVYTKQVTLLIASLVFYGCFQVISYESLQVQYVPLLMIITLSLIMLITLVNFRLGQIIGDKKTIGLQATDQRLSNEEWQLSLVSWNRRRLQLLWLGIVLNVLLLVIFKYVPFLLTSIATLLNLQIAEQGGRWVSTHLIAPLGLSFFVFECIAYLTDVYRGAPATQKFLDFATYKLFFPKLIVGPITRYHQFTRSRMMFLFPSLDQLTEGLWLIACGAVKKALLADQLGMLVDLCFGKGNLERAGSGDLWLALFAYGLQLYLDFSSYVDIARGSAILLGFNLPKNFDFPYFSTSIAEFWRRWHITLGDWLRNYLYFPLGGSRQGLFRTCANLLIVMLIAGLWHGAAWGYLLWGALHGVALVVHRLTEVLSIRFAGLQSWWQSFPGILVAWLLTQSMVFTSWLFFRLPNLKDASLVIGHLWGYTADIQFAQKVYGEAIGLGRIHVALLAIALVALMGVVYVLERGLKLQLNWPLKLLLVPLCLYAVWVYPRSGGLPYIYFDF